MLLDVAFQLSPAVVLSGAVGSVLLLAGHRIQQNYRLRKLGKRPPEHKSRFPLLGFDLLYSSLSDAANNRSYEGWKKKTDDMGYTFEMTILFRRVIFTAEPENIKAILTAQFNDFGKGEAFHQEWYPFLGDSIFATDGDKWQASRQLIRPQFIKERLSDLQTFERNSQKMISIIKAAKGGTVDVSDLFFRFTLDTATEFLLGESIDSLGSPLVAFSEAFAYIQKAHNDMARAGPVVSKFFSKKLYWRHMKTLNEFVNLYVERVIAMSPEELEGKGGQKYNFLHALAGFTKQRKTLRDQIVAVLLAARDTTACTLSWALYELSRHPEVVKKLTAEILEHVGPTAVPTYAHLKEMKFLQHVINETLRLYPAIPLNVRVAMKDTTLPRGGGPDGRDPVAVLKGTTVGYGPILMQRRVDLFGPDAEEWTPERWAGGWAPKPWNYVPFNGGPRICVGQQFALTEMGYVLVRMFQAFDGVEYRDTKKKGMRIEITVAPAEGVKVGFREASMD